MLFGFRLNPVAFRSWPYVLLLSFGPLLFAGIAGLLRVRWVLEKGAAPAALVISSFVFYFTADVPDMGGVWVGWRSGHQLLIAFSIIGAAALTVGWQRRALRLPIGILVLLLTIPAIPTVAIDVYNAQDITNREQGPTFPWTLIITPPEREALTWLRRSTAADALIQVEPYARDTGTWAYIPAFAERRMAAGLPISMIPLDPYRIASENVRIGIFQALIPEDAYTMARRMRIDYLFVGAVERLNYAEGVQRIASRPDLFHPVFTNSAATIYAIAK